MSLLAAIRRVWRSVAPRTSSDVEEEFRSTLEAYQEDLIRQGLSEEEARRKARIDLGRPAAQNEKYRGAIGLRLFDELGGDIRYGLRGLRRNPGFATVAVLSLALGIGATTAMFSLIYAVLLHPFPYDGADRIMNVFGIDDRAPDQFSWLDVGKAELDEVRLAAPVESVLGFSLANVEITGGALPEDIMGYYLTENAGTFFGVRPLLGRNLEPSDAENGGRAVVVLNYQFWQRHFGGDPHVIGRALELNHASYTIIGVMPRSFAFNDMVEVGDVYLPASRTPVVNVSSGTTVPYILMLKLRPHVTRAAANSVLEPIAFEMMKERGGRIPEHVHLALQPIIWIFQKNTGTTLKLLLAGVVLLLIIGCANCSILLLARGRTRRHELAIRSAIGASRWRIVRQLLVEAIVISCAGAILGVVASYWLAKLPLALSPDSFPAESVIHINALILAFSVALASDLRHPLRSCPCIASLASRFRAYAPRQTDWRCRCSRKASRERSDRRAGRAHASAHGHCGQRHPQLSWAHADAAGLRSGKCHEGRHRAAQQKPRRVEPHSAARSENRLHRADPGEDRIPPRCLHCRCRRRCHAAQY